MRSWGTSPSEPRPSLFFSFTQPIFTVQRLEEEQLHFTFLEGRLDCIKCPFSIFRGHNLYSWQLNSGTKGLRYLVPDLQSHSTIL